MKKIIFPLLATSLMVISCTNKQKLVEPLVIDNYEINVYQKDVNIEVSNAHENETFTYSYEGNGLRIEGNQIIGLKGGNEVTVNVTSSEGRTGKFNVTVKSRDYVSKHAEAEANEGWFNDVNISKIDSMTDSFANGMDISSIKQLYDFGQRFYNRQGEEQSLFYILKDSGVNWVRLRLWNKPYDEYQENGETKIYKYGGGNCDINNVSWMAHEAKAAGLKVLLDFHYSDFWADPKHQVVPKDWANITSVDEMAEAVKTFTTNSLLTLKENNALPDMVAIGNETYGGMFKHNPGPVTTTYQNNLGPKYFEDAMNRPRNNGTEANWDFTTNKTTNYNLRAYIKAGVDAAKSVDKNILTSLHFVKGFADPQTSINFFKLFDDIDIDVLGLSGYSYYHFNNKPMETLKNGLGTIAAAFPSKKVAIVETSYGFTYETDSMASNHFIPGGKSGDTTTVSGYPCSIQGQASMIRDTTEVVSNLDNGFGVFYWESAWTPTKQSGWADATSKATWSNQALFSYNGKALGSLDVYAKMKG